MIFISGLLAHAGANPPPLTSIIESSVNFIFTERIVTALVLLFTSNSHSGRTT